MPSLQVRSPLSGVRPIHLLIKATSFLIVVLLLCAGWVGVSYLKNHSSSRQSLLIPTPVSANSTTPAPNSTIRLAATVEPSSQATTRLVYSSTADKNYYHDFKHLQANRGRSAMSEEAAAVRGLKPCSTCFAK
jgi:hypothetical protein